MSLSQSYSFSGNGNWSIDAVSGSATGGGAIQAFIPEGSKIEKAYLYASSYSGGSSSSLTLTYNDQTDIISGFQPLGTNDFGLQAFRSDVTSIISKDIGGGSGTEFNFTLSDINGSNIDGYQLAIVYSNQAENLRTISFLDGFSAPAGDDFFVNFSEPVDTTASGFESLLSLGIGFGFQDASDLSQRSEITVNNRILTSSAGGQDDGVSANGGLITAGGIGDSNTNPADPLSTTGGGPNYDDELYNLALGNAADPTPYLLTGDKTVSVHTFNPSGDDNIYFAGFNVTAKATVTPTPNQAPIAGDDAASTSEATAVMINVAANDSDPDGTIASYALDTAAANGTAVLNADNTFTYTPNAGYTGVDSFVYKVTDDAGATDTATVQVTVNPAGGTQQDSLTLHVAGDSFGGDAQFIVLVDGQQVGGVQTATTAFSNGSGQFQDVTLQGDFGPNPQNVTVQFINDAYGGSSSTDRNLYVDKLIFNGETYEGEHAFNPTGVNTNQPADAAALYFQDAPLVFKLENTLTLSVAEDQYQGDAQFIVLVDGQQIGGVQTATTAFSAGSGQFQDISITGHFASNPGEIEVRFVNDVYGGSSSADRNLYVDKLTLGDGRVFEGEAANNVTGGGTSQPTDAAALYFDQAALIFQTQSLLVA